MLNRNSSAGTAAPQSSKSSLIQRPAIILAMLLLCAVFCYGQYPIYQTLPGGGSIIKKDATRKDTVRVIMLVCDTSDKYKQRVYAEKWIGGLVAWQFGYEVWEMEYGQVPCSENVGTAAIAAFCFGWYKVRRKEYIDDSKKILLKGVVVWQSVSAK